MLQFSERVLSGQTTIKLGGPAKNFIECKSEDEIIEVLLHASENNLNVFVLGGGSNVIFDDGGYEGIILKTGLKGIDFSGDTVSVKAGEDWDEFVKLTVDNDYAGLECLSGIPGTTGATPIQNVGAYGQEVGNVITLVKAIDRQTLKKVTFTNEDCEFSYRKSRFKKRETDRYVITEVIFELKQSGEPEIKYPELEKYIGTYVDLKSLNSSNDRLLAVRDAVLKIRRNKSMIYDENDADSHSCGSFYTNPVLNREDFNKFMGICTEKSLKPPYFKEGKNFKISAAWLIENAGFKKGYTINGMGISNKHTLALVNRGGTTKDLMHLSNLIISGVFDVFGIRPEMEPILAAYR
ncbi:MAG: UDP-N-acetylmuramate dehydrogenase [Ignavibacteria bacterium]|nr:UDP-N-acetylmuramate dehydrogenase [Ignavibacteria bacterium]